MIEPQIHYEICFETVMTFDRTDDNYLHIKGLCFKSKCAQMGAGAKISLVDAKILC